MIDLHCHILDGVDDGAPDVAAALAMATQLVAAGFTAVAASPHMGLGPGGDVPPALATARRSALQAHLDAASVPLRLLPNGEHHVTAEMLVRARDGDVVPVGGSGRWLLVELPWPRIVDPAAALFRLQVAGWRLLLAHPERYTYLDAAACEQLAARGVKLQLELGSFVGVYGGRAERTARRLMAAGAAHVLATDLHRPKQAAQWLQDALRAVRAAYGAAVVQRGLLDNPQALLHGAAVDDVDAMEAA